MGAGSEDEGQEKEPAEHRAGRAGRREGEGTLSMDTAFQPASISKPESKEERVSSVSDGGHKI